ncbi:MAG: hypothetical protein ACRDDY_00705 [Clostridium sp.]|uniref:hypothetical protein n=1 Tax=Clostridium sp. TaxID=1506 RepID=UPI003EE74B6A
MKDINNLHTMIANMMYGHDDCLQMRMISNWAKVRFGVPIDTVCRMIRAGETPPLKFTNKAVGFYKVNEDIREAILDAIKRYCDFENPAEDVIIHPVVMSNDSGNFVYIVDHKHRPGYTTTGQLSCLYNMGPETKVDYRLLNVFNYVPDMYIEHAIQQLILDLRRLQGEKPNVEA